MTREEKKLDNRARRAAHRVGLIARKWRARVGSLDNFGGYMLVNENNFAVLGWRYDLTAEDVIEYCTELERQEAA